MYSKTVLIVTRQANNSVAATNIYMINTVVKKGWLTGIDVSLIMIFIRIDTKPVAPTDKDTLIVSMNVE